MVSLRAGVVSVVLVNFRGADDTIAAVHALRRGDWPAEKLEVVVVDNGSGSDDLPRLRAELDGLALVVDGAVNRGFAGGCNLGAARSTGEYVAFLNNDAEPEAGWLTAAVAVLERDPGVASVASRVLDGTGATVDFVDAAMTWFGHAYKPWVGERAERLGIAEKDVLFGTGSAVVVRRSDFDSVGGFSEDLFMFFEDVDLGWRLNLAGRRVRYVPESVVRHRHHGTAGRFGAFRERYYLDRNALAVLFTNLGDERLSAALPAALALTVRRGVAAGDLDSGAYDYRNSLDDQSGVESVRRDALASIFGVDGFVDLLPALRDRRARVQRTRVRSDADLWPLFGAVDVAAADDARYLEGYEAIVSTFPVTQPPEGVNILVVTGDPLGPRVAGPAIRALAIAGALTAAGRVRLVSTATVEPIDADFELVAVRPGDDRAFRAHEAWADVILFQGHALRLFESLRASEKVIIVDAYDPMHLEQLEQARELPAATWTQQVADATEVLNEQLARADFVLCASERQRQFYLGQLAALGRINPLTYLGDPDLAGLIAIVPFGLSSQPPRHERAALRGVIPGIGADDTVIIWSGGVYSWFDPETLIRAVALVASTHPDIRLFFQGTRHPNPDVPEMDVVARSRRLADDLGLTGRHVFFNDDWVAFSDRQNYLLEADLGVSTHYQHIETTFSFRTRILDYLWAGLPMVVTGGDTFADLVAAEGLGRVVPERDAAALAAALEEMLYTSAGDEARARVAVVRESFTWERTLEPLVRFAARPRRAADADVRRGSAFVGRRPRSRIVRDARAVAHHLRHGGLRVVMAKVRRRLTR